MSNNNIPDNVLINLPSLLGLRFNKIKSYHTSLKKSKTMLAGGNTSPFRGRGIDFSEVRLYQPGDDTRTIDWRVTARTGKVHTKLFIEERERPVLFVIDTGASMQFGTQHAFKSVTAAKVAGTLAWSVVSHGDRVGGVFFAGNEHEEIKPAGGKKGLLQFFNKFVKWSKNQFDVQAVSKPSSFLDVAVRLKRVARPGSLVYILSDFNGMEEQAKNYLAQIALHCDLVLINIYDELEYSPPPPGDYMITNGDTFGKISVDGKKFNSAVQRSFQEKVHSLNQYCIKHGMRFFSIKSGDDIFQILRENKLLK